MLLSVQQGTATGAAADREIHLTVVQNDSTFGSDVLEYVVTRHIDLTRVANAQTFGSLVLNHVVVSFLNQAQVANAQSFGAVDLVALPFVPDNPETTTLLGCCTFAYSTSQKIQIDTLISGLKSAGVWTKLDWFSCYRLMGNEHDSLLNWVNCLQELTKVNSPTYASFVGWTGTLAFSNGRLKSGWNIGDGISSGTDFCAFAKVESIVAAENGMCVLGIWQQSSPGPSAPEGTFVVENAIAGTGFSGAWALPFDAMTGYASGTPPQQHAVSRSGSTQTYYRDGVQVATHASVGTTDLQTHADGVSLLGASKVGSGGRSFNGLQSYGGWGRNLTGTELAAIESAFQAALVPPTALTDALFVDGSDDHLLVDGDDNYLQTE